MNIPTFIYNFLIWCSGSDKKLLRKCTNSERVKHAGYGALVLVPSTMAFISMTYAISTINNNPFIYFSIGVFWALTVFTFDRFLVSTFKKGKSIKDDILSPYFAIRLVFAIFLAIVVSHPFMMLCFKESVDKSLEAKDKTEKNAIMGSFSTSENILSKKIGALKRDEDSVLAYIKSLRENRQAELEGRGSSKTKIEGKGPLYREIDDALGDVIGKYKVKKAKWDVEVKRLEDQRESGRKKASSDTSSLKLAGDYLARLNSFDTLAQTEGAVATARWFLLIFFILIDVLPLTFKVCTNKGNYDVLLAIENNLKIREFKERGLKEQEKIIDFYKKLSKKYDVVSDWISDEIPRLYKKKVKVVLDLWDSDSGYLDELKDAKLRYKDVSEVLNKFFSQNPVFTENVGNEDVSKPFGNTGTDSSSGIKSGVQDIGSETGAGSGEKLQDITLKDRLNKLYGDLKEISKKKVMELVVTGVITFLLVVVQGVVVYYLSGHFGIHTPLGLEKKAALPMFIANLMFMKYATKNKKNDSEIA